MSWNKLNFEDEIFVRWVDFSIPKFHWNFTGADILLRFNFLKMLRFRIERINSGRSSSSVRKLGAKFITICVVEAIVLICSKDGIIYVQYISIYVFSSWHVKGRCYVEATLHLLILRGLIKYFLQQTNKSSSLHHLSLLSQSFFLKH